MSQQQRPIPIHYASGKTGIGVATGNNAGWPCDCAAQALLVGYSDTAESTRESSLVLCPVCRQPYRVCAAYLRGRAMSVRAA
jgi:hypothetical protein